LSIITFLTACGTTPKQNQHKYFPDQPSINNSYHSHRSYICQTPQHFAGNVVGDGHCVSLIQRCSPAPHTSHWVAGEKVLSLRPGTIAPGTIIATFQNGKYPNKSGYHAAIYIRHDSNGIWVWDQWVGKAVHQRLIRVRHDNATASNTAQAYRIVR